MRYTPTRNLPAKEESTYGMYFHFLSNCNWLNTGPLSIAGPARQKPGALRPPECQWYPPSKSHLHPVQCRVLPPSSLQLPPSLKPPSLKSPSHRLSECNRHRCFSSRLSRSAVPLSLCHFSACASSTLHPCRFILPLLQVDSIQLDILY